MFSNNKRKIFFPLSVSLLIFLIFIFAILTPGFKGGIDQEIEL